MVRPSAAVGESSRIEFGEVVADLVRKDVKHVHLCVYPPSGHVRIAAPAHLDVDTIRVFALSKLRWIKQQQRELRGQARESPREYVERESHYLWGRRYLLRIRERPAAPQVELRPKHLLLHLRPGTDEAARHRLVDRWYRDQIRAAVSPLLERWQPILGVRAAKVFVQRMKTRWGSCNPASGNIRLNTELAKKPPQCLEYLLVHELIHLLEPTHNERFRTLMDRHLPQWRHHRRELNRLPIRHETCRY